MQTEKAIVAVWYYDVRDEMTVGLFGSEATAADFAVSIEDNGTGTPMGVEFPNGDARIIDDWEEFIEARERAEEKEEEKQDPPPPTRTVLDPFTRESVEIPRKAPQWVGLKKLPKPNGS